MIRTGSAIVAVTSALALAACTHPSTVVAPCPTPAEPVAAVPPLSTPTVTTPPTASQPAKAVRSGYDQPAQVVLDVLHAPRPPQPMVSPTRQTILLVAIAAYPSIAQVAEPYLRLAGVRVEPRTRRKHDTPGGYGVAQCAQELTLVDVATKHSTPLALPAGGCADNFRWSPDGKRIAYANTATDAVELWIADAATGVTKRLGTARLNPMLGSSIQWMPDSRSLLVKVVPANPGTAPVSVAAADGPSIQETTGQSGESSTYETRDTLSNKHDEALFTYFGTSQLAVVDAATGALAPVGTPAVIAEVDPAPDGDHLLVSTIQQPYSYVTTYDRFAHDVAVWTRAGAITALAHLPVADRVPVAGVALGARDHAWRATAPATLVWAEALDGGDWNVKAAARDKVMMLAAPFTAAPVEILRTEQRYAGLDWSESKAISLLHEYDENRHWDRTFVVDVDAATRPLDKAHTLWDLSSDEHYADPGSPVYRMSPTGQWLVQLDGPAIFAAGSGSSTTGDHPFLDRLDLSTRKSTRLFHSDATALEQFIAFGDSTNRTLLTWRQSPMDPPNAMLRTLAPTGAPSAPQAITQIADPTPSVRSITKTLVKYKRKDGTPLSFTLITPPGYVKGTRIPAVLYAYPLDYAQASTAGQVTGSELRFTTLRDYQLLLLAGYAVIDNAAFPIVGDPKKAYDTYLPQLVADAQAAVDAAVATGVVDRARIGVTGHSHGALMTANLIAHTKLFKAGVATSGSYNKTLTPFGFQSERRSVWKARKVYEAVSTFFVADQIKLPLLIVHGSEDANPGTTPLQAVKLYEAIRGNGGTSRLVMLPHEPHWYAAMESNEQLAYEEARWFDRYVKSAAPAKPAK